MAVALSALSGTADAQSTAASPPAAVPHATPARLYGPTEHQWIVSGFVGSNFGSSTIDPSVDFGGQLAFLWKGVIGAEALADFAPSFRIDNLVLADHPHANSYMANLIFATPLGAEGQIEPYISGGVGAVQLRTTVLNLALPNSTGALATGTSDGDQMLPGTDLGGGVMGFAGMIGFRADVRYYKVPTDTTFQSNSAVGQVTEGLLSGLSFWRANIGVAVRW
jgi:hypothetical protein